MKRVLRTLLAMALGACAATAAHAQADYPAKPVRVLVGYAPAAPPTCMPVSSPKGCRSSWASRSSSRTARARPAYWRRRLSRPSRPTATP